MAALDNERLSLVFGSRPDIIQGIQQAADSLERTALFNSITDFVSSTYLPTTAAEFEHGAKRRRISGDAIKNENGLPTEGQGMLAPLPIAHAAVPKPAAGVQQAPGAERLLIELAEKAAAEVILLEVKEVSVSIPQRKKYDLCFTKNYLYTKVVGTTAPVQGMVYNWNDIEYVFYAPIPEKQQLHYNYILFPRNTALSSTKSWPAVDFEPLVFTVPTTAPKAGVVSGYAAATAARVSDSYSSLMHWAINSQLTSVGNTAVTIVGTDARVFHSALRQPHRPNEKAVHVKAFRGSKDGFLFFLPNGILWGFKKPLLFIPLDRIVAMSYTSVLQRTFNIEVEVDVSHAPEVGQKGSAPSPWANGSRGGEDGEGGLKTEVIEFAMIDQEDYQSIDETYVRRHGLHNRSMAEGRRAKRQLRENARDAPGVLEADPQGEHAVGADGGEDHVMAELDRAEQMLQDEEDEEEEDYDPGSEGESEGEGVSSEEEDDDDDEDGEEGDEGDEGDEEAEGYDEDGLEEGGYVEDHE